MKREKRLDALRAILATHVAATQRELLDELAVAGHRITQGTLSLDLQRLHAGKVKTRGGYRYVLPREQTYVRAAEELSVKPYMQQGVCERLSFSGSLAVLKTRAGQARGLAADIDAAALPTVAGTVAGDDTVFVAQTDGTSRARLLQDLTAVIPSLAALP